MTKKQFRKLADRAGVMTGFASYDGCELVMVKGMIPADAARRVRVHQSTICRAMKRLRAAQEES